jgi:myo-inositol 2-dehydrogenase/D-chiro-inositol 1-dehydrogenase
MDMTRRNLLAISATAPAILRAQSPDNEVRVAFVGVGNRGSFLLENALKVPGLRVVAVCDIVRDRAMKAAARVEAAGGSARVWEDFRKMLDEQKEIDAVVLATPDWTHKDFNIAILEVGKHLYAEKPLALTPEDCQAVVSAARQAKGIFQVGFQNRHDPQKNAAEKFIHGGGIGRVLMCHGIRHGGDLPRQIPWYFDRTRSGDILVDQAIHMVDLFNWAIGSHPLRAMGSGGANLFEDEPPGRTVMDNYSVIYEYPHGVRMNLSHHYFDPPGFTGRQEKVFGSEGAVDLMTAVWQPRRKKERIKLDVPDAGRRDAEMALAYFADHLRRGDKNVLNSAESAMESTLTALLGTKAIYERRIVTWEEILPRA